MIISLPFSIDLTGKVAVVTGAGCVLCSMFSKALAQCGAKVAMLDLNEQAARVFADEINAGGGIAKAYWCDVLNADSMKAAREQILNDLGECDLLINGAGGNHPKATTTMEYYEAGDFGAGGAEAIAAVGSGPKEVTFFDLESEGIQFVFNLNFLGTLIPVQAFAKGMAGRPGSAIINISSMASFRALTKTPAYSAAKAAISNLTQWLAVHFSRAGIRVNAIAPGFFLTKQNEALLVNPDGTPTARSKKVLAQTPMGRYGKPEELLGALLLLADSGAASFINGTVITVDGGYNAYSGV